MEDHHVDRPGVEAEQSVKLTGSDRPTVSHPNTMHGNHRQIHSSTHNTHQNLTTRDIHGENIPHGMDRTTWWSWRGARTRSLPELGRENPQRPWYCVLRHGRVGRRQVFQSILTYTHAGWSSPVARQAHNLKVTGSNPVPATKFIRSAKAPVSPALFACPSPNASIRNSCGSSCVPG